MKPSICSRMAQVASTGLPSEKGRGFSQDLAYFPQDPILSAQLPLVPLFRGQAILALAVIQIGLSLATCAGSQSSCPGLAQSAGWASHWCGPAGSPLLKTPADSQRSFSPMS
jgi:hypothetical protein